MALSPAQAAVAAGIHSARFATYLRAAEGDAAWALELYRWNILLAGALHESLSLTEVFLRNAIDAKLRIWNSAQPNLAGGLHSAEWLLDPARPLNTMTSTARKTATTNAARARAQRPSSHPRKGDPVGHDDILAQMSFGVFARLLPTPNTADKEYTARKILWEQSFVLAFPLAKDDPHGFIVADRAHRLRSLRNRVAHLEPLLDVNVTARFRDMVRLVGAIDRDQQAWLAGVARVREVERQRPQPATRSPATESPQSPAKLP